MPDDLKWRHMPLESQQGIELGQQDQHGRRVLKARHDGRRDVLHQAPEAKGAEQRLEQTGDEHHEEDQGQGLADIALVDDPGL